MVASMAVMSAARKDKHWAARSAASKAVRWADSKVASMDTNWAECSVESKVARMVARLEVSTVASRGALWVDTMDRM